MTDETTEVIPVDPEHPDAVPVVEEDDSLGNLDEAHEPNDATTEDDDEPKTDAEQGVGLAPTEPGDAGEGNPGTHFETTEQIEAADLSKSGEVAGVQ